MSASTQLPVETVTLTPSVELSLSYFKHNSATGELTAEFTHSIVRRNESGAVVSETSLEPITLTQAEANAILGDLSALQSAVHAALLPRLIARGSIPAIE